MSSRFLTAFRWGVVALMQSDILGAWSVWLWGGRGCGYALSPRSYTQLVLHAVLVR